MSEHGARESLFAVRVGFKGEGYSERIVGVRATTSDEARAAAIAWYAGQIGATDITTEWNSKLRLPLKVVNDNA